MNMPTLLSVVLLGATVSNCGFAQADPNPTNGKAPAASAPPAVCLQDTGSRLPQKDTRCATAGTSHTGEDLSKTGKASSVGDGLKMLNPAVTVTNR
jgi:hypothetical protein